MFAALGSCSHQPREWKGAPVSTKSFAIVMDHLDRNNLTKTYWTVYDIPPTVTSIPKNMQGIGALGASWKRDLS
ncbi:MAG: hypothetical protein KDB22_24810 [Planctomycetales bacterium]|nr:hypothetical protein [Planctomycetales bacterium]